MKVYALLSVFITLFVITVYAEDDAVGDEVFREEYCNNAKNEECSSYRCNKDNSKIIAIPCAEARCSGKTVGFKGDPSKSYPECCMIPICEEFTNKPL